MRIFSDPTIPMGERPLHMGQNYGQLVCEYCHQTVKKTNANQIICGRDTCRAKRKLELLQAKAARAVSMEIGPAELLEIARAKGVA